MNGYDAELQMFVDEKRELDYTKLEFLRWLYQETDAYQEDSDHAYAN